jgi:hypothetical protein
MERKKFTIDEAMLERPTVPKPSLFFPKLPQPELAQADTGKAAQANTLKDLNFLKAAKLSNPFPDPLPARKNPPVVSSVLATSKKLPLTPVHIPSAPKKLSMAPIPFTPPPHPPPVIKQFSRYPRLTRQS